LLLGVLPFYAAAILGRETEGTWVAILAATAIAVTLATVPVLSRRAGRSSKRRVFGHSMLLAALVSPLLAVAGFLPGLPQGAQILLLIALVGVPIAGVYLFPSPLTADIVGHDETRTGMRREATYYGAQNFVEKTAGSVSPPLLTLVLLLGSTADDPLGIRLAGPVAGLFVLAGFFIFRRYELTDHVTVPAGREGAALPAAR
jgi:Na+/melibiose symporter-like transporter